MLLGHFNRQFNPLTATNGLPGGEGDCNYSTTADPQQDIANHHGPLLLKQAAEQPEMSFDGSGTRS
jgi:hypothetical protein